MHQSTRVVWLQEKHQTTGRFCIPSYPYLPASLMDDPICPGALDGFTQLLRRAARAQTFTKSQKSRSASFLLLAPRSEKPSHFQCSKYTKKHPQMYQENHNINVSQNNAENAYFSTGTASLHLTTPSDVWLVIRQAIAIVKWSVSVGIEPTETAATPG